jgi:hypothetical protein
MDSKAYKYLAAKIIDDYPNLSGCLPVEFYSKDIRVSDQTLKAVNFFVSRLILDPENSSSDRLAIPAALGSDTTQNFLSELFCVIHLELIKELQETHSGGSQLFKRNGAELLTLLCNGVSAKWLPIFNKNDALSYAMCCFLIEACMNIGWCPNVFEHKAKRAAHLYFSHLRKSLFNAGDSEISTILGYLQSARICAQKTEGIRDKIPEWETNDLINTYSFEIEGNSPVQYTLFRLLKAQVCITVPKYIDKPSHPFGLLFNEGKPGLTLLVNNKEVFPERLLEENFINRQNINGIQLVYSCAASKEDTIIWSVIIQIFKATIYRIDVIQPKEQSFAAEAELRLENPNSLSETKNNEYYGKGSINSAVTIPENPFRLNYHSQEQTDISLFRGNQITLSPEKPIESIVAWTMNEKTAVIDKTNLLGIFDISKFVNSKY